MSKLKVYEQCVSEAVQLIDEESGKHSLRRSKVSGEPSSSKLWPDGGNNQMLFQGDTAFELGGGGKYGIGGLFLTADENVVSENEIVVIGPDLTEMKANCSYARIAFVLVDEAALGDGKEEYQNIRKIEYTRYRVSPSGFMVRISAMNHKEAVRVGKDAVKKQISFANVGRNYISAYCAHPAVKAVKLIFVTAPDADYKRLSEVVGKSENITKTLDHLLTKVNMDCDSCGLKVICDEVEQML